jgi:hypothetical protein
MRLAMSTHDFKTPLTPAELRTLAAEMEESVIESEGGFSHPDWRYIDGMRVLATRIEEADRLAAKRCACPTSDPFACARARYGDDNDREPCECSCHERDDDVTI